MAKRRKRKKAGLSKAEAVEMVLVEYVGKQPGVLHGMVILPGERRRVPRWAYEQAKAAAPQAYRFVTVGNNDGGKSVDASE